MYSASSASSAAAADYTMLTHSSETDPNLGLPVSLRKARVQSDFSREMASATSLLVIITGFTAPYSFRNRKTA